jgi:hypothetical protein
MLYRYILYLFANKYQHVYFILYHIIELSYNRIVPMLVGTAFILSLLQPGPQNRNKMSYISIILHNFRVSIRYAMKRLSEINV